MGKNLPLRGKVRTNIGTTIPPAFRLTEPAIRFANPAAGTKTGLPVALPVAQFEGEEAGPKVIAPEPLWISRWQYSKRPIGAKERPWVKGYRWWVAGVKYETWGPDPLYRIDFMWKDYRRGYRDIPAEEFEDFKHLTGSVGEWFHNHILVPNWRPGAGARYPEVAI